jgi:hypothetical protein
MSDLATVDDLKAAQQKLADANLRNAQLAAGTIALLIEEMGVHALTNQDPSEMAKVVNALQGVATHPEKQAAAKATVSAAGALLQIILDENVPQVAPPKKAKALPVEDAVEITGAPQAAAVPLEIQQDDNWSAGWAE